MKKIFNYQEIDELIETLNSILRRNNGDVRIGITGMFANPLHAGHIDLLREAYEKCDYLLVAINNDYYATLKSGYSFMDWYNRSTIVSSLCEVDWVIENSFPTMEYLLENLPVTHYFKGGDIDETNLLQCEKDVCSYKGIKICYGTGGQKTFSSSQFLESYYQYRTRNIEKE